MRSGCFFLAVAGLAGCASTQDIVPLEQSHLKLPIKVLVMESPMDIDRGRLHSVLVPSAKAGSPESDTLISQGERHAQESALADMNLALGKQKQIKVIMPAPKDGSLIDKIGGKSFADDITQDDANALHSATGADALLRFGITDYGLTPKSWRNGYITFEVTTTLGLAALIAYPGTVIAKAAAGTYLAEEAAEETAEGYAGSKSLDVVYRPVRVDAELIRLNPVAKVWEYSDTGLSDRRLSRLTSKVTPEERNRQLDQATSYAVNDIVNNLAAAVGNIR